MWLTLPLHKILIDKQSLAFVMMWCFSRAITYQNM